MSPNFFLKPSLCRLVVSSCSPPFVLGLFLPGYIQGEFSITSLFVLICIKRPKGSLSCHTLLWGGTGGGLGTSFPAFGRCLCSSPVLSIHLLKCHG